VIAGARRRSDEHLTRVHAAKAGSQSFHLSQLFPAVDSMKTASPDGPGVARPGTVMRSAPAVGRGVGGLAIVARPTDRRGGSLSWSRLAARAYDYAHRPAANGC
jgi:hypothetical protein